MRGNGMMLLRLLAAFLFCSLANAESLTDNHKECATWAATKPSECIKNPDWMLRNCAASCASKKDKEELCPKWAALTPSECILNPAYMLENCAASCARISSSTTTVGTQTTTTTSFLTTTTRITTAIASVKAPTSMTNTSERATNTKADATYIASFQKTGCINADPEPLRWWKTQDDSIVWLDMYTYCSLVHDGLANARQKEVCCGSADCQPSCVKQGEQETGCRGSDEQFISTFHQVGCINPTPDIDFWKKAPEIAWEDMHAYCARTRDGSADVRQRNFCCGNNVRCIPVTCNKPTFWTCRPDQVTAPGALTTKTGFSWWYRRTP